MLWLASVTRECYGILFVIQMSSNMDMIVVDKKVEHTSGSESVTTEADYEEFYQDMKVNDVKTMPLSRRKRHS